VIAVFYLNKRVYPLGQPLKAFLMIFDDNKLKFRSARS